MTKKCILTIDSILKVSGSHKTFEKNNYFNNDKKRTKTVFGPVIVRHRRNFENRNTMRYDEITGKTKEEVCKYWKYWWCIPASGFVKRAMMPDSSSHYNCEKM